MRPFKTFGCIYHEARQEKKCSNCGHWGGECYWRDSLRVMMSCSARTNVGEALFSTGDNTCDRWSEKHG
jgi:hypothetical protein